MCRQTLGFVGAFLLPVLFNLFLHISIVCYQEARSKEGLKRTEKSFARNRWMYRYCSKKCSCSLFLVLLIVYTDGEQMFPGLCVLPPISVEFGILFVWSIFSQKIAVSMIPILSKKRVVLWLLQILRVLGETLALVYYTLADRSHFS